jgi:hypothetical protein
LKTYPKWYEMPKVGDPEADFTYRFGHSKRPTVRMTLEMIHGFSDSTSIIDVGCGSLGLLGTPHAARYETKVAIDIYPPSDPGFGPEVKFICGDFLTTEVGQFSVCAALECVEHVEPHLRRPFVQKLLATATKHLLISIPFMWDGCREPIPHNHISESNLMEWTYPILQDWEIVEAGHMLARFDRI